MIEEIKYSIKNIGQRKLRSSLTILSILIGIAAIFALISFGSGIRHYMDVLAEDAGANMLFIQAKGSGFIGDEAFFLSREDVDFVKKVNGVEEVAGLYMEVVQIKKKDDIRYVFLMGYDPKNYEFIFDGFGAEVSKGRVLKSGEQDKILLGYNYQLEDKIFSKPLSLGDSLEINGIEFEIAGFIEEVGNPQDDSNIYVTEDTFELLYPNKKDRFGYVMVKSYRTEDPEVVADRIEEKLRKRLDQKEGEEEFTVQSFADLLETFNTFISIINGILILIALISVIVASVNIMNTMYTAVLERTKEIGIMKAIGARNSKILFIFVFESGFLGLVGGILGELLGYAISSFGGYIALISGYSSLQPYFSPNLIIGCLVFSFIIGAASGFLPAKQASKLKPTEALRYE